MVCRPRSVRTVLQLCDTRTQTTPLTMQPTTRTFFFAWVVFCLRYSISEARACGGIHRGTCPPNSVCSEVPNLGIYRCVILIGRTTAYPPASGERLPMTPPPETVVGLPVVEARSDGVCPRNLNGPCVLTCTYHGDCRSDEACCSTGCGRKCTPRRQSGVQKYGSCREPSQTFPEPCGERCGRDSDCPGQDKCCRTYCGKTCQAPCYHWLNINNGWRLSNRCSQSQSVDRTPSGVDLPYATGATRTSTSLGSRKQNNATNKNSPAVENRLV